MTLFSAIWGMLTPRQRRAILLMQLVSLVMALSTASGVAAIGPFFAVLGDPGLVQHNAWLRWLYRLGGFRDERTLELALGVGFVAVVLIANLISVLGFLAMKRLALRISNELQTTLFAEYLSRPYAFHSRSNSATLLNSILYETMRVTDGVLENAFMLVTSIITAGLIVASIVLVSAKVAVALVGALAAGYGLIYLAVRERLLRAGERQSRFATEQAQIATESFGAIKEIAVLQAQAFFHSRFERASRDFLRAATHVQLVGHTPRHLMECVAAAGLVSLALVLGGREGGLGRWLGPLTFLAFAAYRLLPLLQQVFVAIVRIRSDWPAVERIGPDLRRARARQAGAAVGPACPAGIFDDCPRRDIELREVSYRYAADRSWALRGVSARIPARATTGIVGANGAGKSTLIDLLAGLLTPAEGVVTIDGCTLDDGNRAAWQARIAYVPQSVYLLDATVAQNIALGVASAAIDTRRLREAARLAQLDEFVMTLPDGYAQRVGERGVALSGGQRQRVGIARALYRNAPVLLLDEATDALDGLTEQELVTTLGRLRGRYTIVLIAHRIDSMRACDLIFELEHGRVVGSGSYQRLRGGSGGLRRPAGVV